LEASCQRCHEGIREGDRYCWNCGMPQLVYVAAELPLVVLTEDATESGGVSLPGSGLGSGLGSGDAAFSPGGIAWRPALNAAMLLAVPTGILCFGFLPIGLFWMVAAAAWAVGVYARRVKPASLTLGMGVRIGMVTGLFTSWFTVGLYGAGAWVTRFVLHQGGEWDSLYAAQVVHSNQQMLAEMGSANPEAVQMAQSIKVMLLSSEGRAGFGLGMAVLLVMFLVFFSIIGGALGSRLQVSSRQRSA
jgi:hypothetical protein